MEIESRAASMEAPRDTIVVAVAAVVVVVVVVVNLLLPYQRAGYKMFNFSQIPWSGKMQIQTAKGPFLKVFYTGCGQYYEPFTPRTPH